ncbi:MAG: LPS export ABC transporter periplasmic protein LptC [Gammaproteobacteria bacterium]
MFERWRFVIIMLVLAAASAWLLHKITSGKTPTARKPLHQPDYYMENFTITNMEEDGTLKNQLEAEYMAHYPDDDTTELVKPRLAIPRADGQPVHIIADKGWVTTDNKVILLTGNVALWQNDDAGNKKIEITTSDVRILTDEEYAETDQPSVFTGKDTTVRAIGVRAYLKEGRLQLLNNVHATILPEKSD